MHIVALTELAGPMEGALAAIATLVGSSAYDLRLVLNAGFPAVVLVTDDGETAARAVVAIRRQGHGAVACDRRAITPSGKMTAIRVIAFGPHDITPASFAGTACGAGPAEGAGDRLPYSGILCMLRATHATTTETVSHVKERKLRPGMAVATGGLIMSKTTSREVRSSQEHRQQVLYVFRHGGDAPWILRERETNYAGLGSKLAPSAFQNFATAIQALRERAPNAAYDERLVKSRPIRGVAAGIETVDVHAHLLAAHFAERGARPAV